MCNSDNKLEALRCEAKAITARFEAMKADNKSREISGLPLCYGESSFLDISDEFKAMAEKFRYQM